MRLRICLKINYSKKILSKVKKPLGFEAFDNSIHFLESFDRVSEEGYIPTNEDIFRSVHVPMGIKETTFDFVSMKFKYVFYDCPTEKTKYLQCFSDINLLIYCSDADICEEEDKFEEDIKYFTDIINSKLFQHSNILLLFKKRDGDVNRMKNDSPESEQEKEEKFSIYLSKLFF